MMQSGVDRFFQDYPDGHLITLVRHPGAWLASMSRFKRAEQNLDEWKRSAAASLSAYRAYPDRVTVVIFDDLVLATEATMRAICARVGLTFDPVLLEPTFNSMPASSDSSFVAVKVIDPAVITRYKEVLTPAQLEEVRDVGEPRYREVQREFSLSPHVVP
jgi:hypothetical protein